MRSRLLVCLGFAAATPFAPAQTPLRPPVPLVQAATADTPAPGQTAAMRTAAEHAQEMGFPTIAVGLYQQLLAAPDGTVGDRWQLRLALVTALLDAGRVGEADKALNDDVGVRGAAWQLRAGLIAMQTQPPRLDAAKAAVAAIKPADLSEADRGWFLFLQGMIADAAHDWDRGAKLYEEAIKAQTNEMARTRFELARELALLRRGVANLDALRVNAERIQGRYGYETKRQYAIGLNARGSRGEAMTELQKLLPAIPPSERDEIDKVRLLLGLIGGAADGTGRNALFQLLASGQDPGRQRIALQLLADASPRGTAATEFRQKIDTLIGQTPAHPVLEYLLLARAQVALTEKEYAQAESDAKQLLDQFPGSPLRVHALGVLTSSAWEQQRWRLSADYAAKARGALPAGAARAQLGVLVAEAWYRAGDYPNAAEAYAAVLREPPPGEPLGALMFQRVFAEMQAAQGDAARLAAAARLLDELGRDPAFDLKNRWQAEWNLAREMQLASQTAAAYARVNRLLAAGADATLPAELRARMAWLQVRLSLDAEKPAETVQLADRLGPFLEGTLPALRTEIASAAALLKAQAEFALAQPTAALATLQKLRADFPQSDAAAYSYLTEADDLARRDQTVEAQKRLTQLAETYKDSPYAPLALFRAALLSEQRGQDEEADRRIEQLVNLYPKSDLVFYARLKQGDLRRKLNEFALAQQAYEWLVNNFPQHADVWAAKMALADCRAAQTATDPTFAERAAEIYEPLLTTADRRIGTDLRVEAGYKLGLLYAKRGKPDRAKEIWWRDVVNAFLLKPEWAAERKTTGPYWMSRTLLDLGTLLEQETKLEEARKAWLLVVESKLPGEALAKAKLAQFNPPEAKP
jgi:cellulose synthase operon protein C